MHWSTRWLGLPYVRRRYECGEFVVDVQIREFGRALALPRAHSVRERDRLVLALQGELAVATPAPAEGDGVLMRARGRRSGVGHHLGVWCAPPGGPHVLHLTPGLGSCLHAIASLLERDLELVGVYRWL